MTIIFQKAFLTLKVEVPDQEWEKVSEETKAKLLKDIEAIAGETRKQVFHFAKPLLDKFLDDVATLQTSTFDWQGKQ